MYPKIFFLDFTPNVNPYLMKIECMGSEWGKLGIRSKIKFLTGCHVYKHLSVFTLYNVFINTNVYFHVYIQKTSK